MFLLIFRTDEGAFGKDEFLRLFDSIADVFKKRGPRIGSFVSGEFEFQGYSTLVRFKPDLQVIALSDENPAAYEIGLRLQRACGAPLRMVDEGTSFDLELKDYSSVEDLSHAIEMARG